MNLPQAQPHARDESGTDVAVFHRIIHDVTSDGADIAAVLWRHFSQAPGTPLRDGDWDRLASDFSGSVSGDMDAEHSARLTGRVFAELQRSPCPATMDGLVERIERVYREIGAQFADLLIDFVHSALMTSRREGVSETVFLARDAVPFYVIARELTTRGIACQPVSLLDLNRGMIPAFAAPPTASRVHNEALVVRYLAARFAARERVAIVDTGLYGTLIRATLEMRLFEDPVVMFFASKNPNIYGYLNGLGGSKTERTAALDAFGEACCDTVETWPKLYTPSELHFDGQDVRAISAPTDLVSGAASLALYRALAQRARTADLPALEPRDASALPLAEPLPRWEHADAWQAAWQSGPIAPVG